MSIGAILHVLQHSKALQSHQTILVQLANHANDAGVAWPSVTTLMAKTGYKRRWIEMVLEELHQLGECRREKVGRGYRYQLFVYDTKKKTCTCAVSASIESDHDAHAQLVPEQAQLLPGYVQLLPRYAQSSVANSPSQKPNASDPCSDPCLNLKSEPGDVWLAPESEETETTAHVFVRFNGIYGWCERCHQQAQPGPCTQASA